VDPLTDTIAMRGVKNTVPGEGSMEHRLQQQVGDGGSVEALLKLEQTLNNYQNIRRTDGDDVARKSVEALLQDCYEDLYVP